MALETVDYFMRNDSDVYVCVMDMKKAFDTVQHSVLFKKLVHKGIPYIYIRLLMVMYKTQCANVKWNGVTSSRFAIKNGVKQGAVLSAILFCVYIDELFPVMRRKRSGCWVNGDFVGMLGYADDIMLLSPTLEGLQDMVDTCAAYMSVHNLSFSTNPDTRKCKTKCMSFSKTDRIVKNIKLYGNDLPWVTSIQHLGSKIENRTKGTTLDLMEKRAMFINRNNELIQEFHFAHPITLIRANNIFNTSFYGSVIWNLFDDAAERLEKSWNISQRLMLNLHRETHRFLIEPLSEIKHIMLSLYKRYIKFTKNLSQSKKGPLRNLYNLIKYDCRSTTGSNLRRLMLRLDVRQLEELNADIIGQAIYKDIPAEDEWKVQGAK